MPNRKFSPELLDYSQWPGVNVQMLTESEAIRFSRLEAAVKAACDGVKSAEINRQFGIKRSLLHYYLVKCTSRGGQLWSDSVRPEYQVYAGCCEVATLMI